ncbi:MAG: choice-of-anchor I family protein [Flavisolibacter sp.]
MKRKILLPALAVFILVSCGKNDTPHVHEDLSSFSEISSITIGGKGAAEISAYDPLTKKLFVVTNLGVTTRIDVINLVSPSLPVLIDYIDISPYGGGVNSVSVSEGKLAAAIEGFVKTDPGKVVVFRTTDYAVVKQVPVGALPDMIAYSYDGKYILTANEGEPNDSYTIDPIGTVSIISVKDNYSVVNLDFASFAPQLPMLRTKGLRVFGPGANFAQDIEPEYLTISSDSKTAWVTLQENNAIAKINIQSKTITDIFPLGFKSYHISQNEIDPSDKDGGILPDKWKVKGMYQPDGIAVFESMNKPFLFTANEGDVREWGSYKENERVKDLDLDDIAFPNEATLKTEAKLGRLNVTKTLGDAGLDNDYDELYSFGARSFSIWNGLNGHQVYDSKNQLEQKCIEAGYYDDNRSDDKGVEPEGITIGYVGRKVVAFIGMERADAVAIYDITNPHQPRFIKLLSTGDAPEGILFIPAQLSPAGKSLLVVSSEDDGSVKIYTTH